MVIKSGITCGGSEQRETSNIILKAIFSVTLLLVLTCCTSSMEVKHRQEMFRGSQAIIIDHTTTDLSKIPDHWLQKAKNLKVYYAHTSHGSQLISGAKFLAERDPRFRISVLRTGTDNPRLTSTPDSLKMNSTFGNPATFWEPYYTGGGHTRIVGKSKQFDYAMFSWCGEQSGNSEETVKRYLEALDGYEKEFPHMRFIYMTGHTDGRNLTLRRNNEIIREYCARNNKILYDFADIESWSPDGQYDSLANQDCTWCEDWCENHHQECLKLPKECAHSPNNGGAPEKRYNCVLKAKAFWWMMARLAGWNPNENDLLGDS